MDPRLIHQMRLELGVTFQHLQQIQHMPVYEMACEALENLKEVARVRYKKLAFEYHPDRNPGDASAEVKFKILGKLLEELKGLRLQKPAPVLHHTVVVAWQAGPVRSPVTSYKPSSTTATTSTYHARRVVFIRP